MKVQDFIAQGFTKEEAKDIIALYQQEKESWSKLHSQILDELGLYPAAVFGVIEGYAKMDHRVCYAAQGTIAQRLNISRGSVNSAIKKLCEAGYLENTTPDKRNRSHKLKVLWNGSGVTR